MDDIIPQLTHYRVNGNKYGELVWLTSLRGSVAMFDKFSWCARTVEKSVTNWGGALTDAGVNPDHYVGIKVPYWNTIGTFGFERRDHLPPDPPDLIIFNTTDHYDDTAIQKIHSAHPGAIVKIVHGPVGTLNNDQTWLYSETISRQRFSVDPLFFDQFGPFEYVTDRATLQHIRDVISHDQRPRFSQNFVDCWDDQTSFAFINWAADDMADPLIINQPPPE
jgi:hypothetical protein